MAITSIPRDDTFNIIRKVSEALGIDWQKFPMMKMVIELDCKVRVPKIYISGICLDSESAKQIGVILAEELSITEKCEVIAKEKDNYSCV